MLTDRQLRAWNELGLGPAWTQRRAVAGRQADPTVDGAEAPLDEIAEDSGETMEAAGGAGIVARTAASAGTEASRASWEAISAEVQACRRCGLCETRKRTVFGSGPQGARWMLIGEAPGAEEDARGEPFVGQAGRLLDQMLASIGLSRETDVFITNVLKCRPPGNRNPEPLEAETCSTYLYRQIELLQPELIVLLGRFAMQSVLKTDANVASLRQRVHHYPGVHRRIPVICTYHPAYLLRNLPEKRKSWEDLCLALDVARREQAGRRAAAGD